MLKKYGFFILLYFIAMLVEAKTFEEEMRLPQRTLKNNNVLFLKIIKLLKVPV